MDFIQSVIGRFHPIVVHLPIGILILAFAFDLISLQKKFRHLKKAVRPALFLGTCGALVSCITGYFLSLEGGYAEGLLSKHQYLGIGTAVLSFLLFFLRKSQRIIRSEIKHLNIILFMPVILLVGITGHYGGSLTHGEDFMTFAVEDEKPEVTFTAIANIDSAVLYTDLVKPILKSKCYSCHSSKKQKGDLRLDEIELIKLGGKEGEVIVYGLPDSSSLYTRLILPLENEHHMPPKGKPQPTSSEIAIINEWIKDGGSFDERVSESAGAMNFKRYVSSMQSAGSLHWVPTESVTEADQRVIADLRERGIEILPVDQQSHFLTANFINADSISDEDLKDLGALKDQLVWMSLEGSSVSDEQFEIVTQLKNLRWLYLNNTKISDKAISLLPKLQELIYLNLVNTAVTDKSIEDLSKMKTLRQLFIYKTQVTPEAAAKLQSLLPKCKINTGNFMLPRLNSDTLIYSAAK